MERKVKELISMLEQNIYFNSNVEYKVSVECDGECTYCYILNLEVETDNNFLLFNDESDTLVNTHRLLLGFPLDIIEDVLFEDRVATIILNHSRIVIEEV